MNTLNQETIDELIARGGAGKLDLLHKNSRVNLDIITRNCVKVDMGDVINWLSLNQPEVYANLMNVKNWPGLHIFYIIINSYTTNPIVVGKEDMARIVARDVRLHGYIAGDIVTRIITHMIKYNPEEAEELLCIFADSATMFKYMHGLGQRLSLKSLATLYKRGFGTVMKSYDFTDDDLKYLQTLELRENVNYAAQGKIPLAPLSIDDPFAMIFNNPLIYAYTKAVKYGRFDLAVRIRNIIMKK